MDIYLEGGVAKKRLRTTALEQPRMVFYTGNHRSTFFGTSQCTQKVKRSLWLKFYQMRLPSTSQLEVDLK